MAVLARSSYIDIYTWPLAFRFRSSGGRMGGAGSRERLCDLRGGWGAWVLGEPSTFLGLRLYVPIALLIVAHLLLEHLLPPILG